MVSALSVASRALPYGACAVACALLWHTAGRLEWLQGFGSWMSLAAFILLLCVVLAVRGTLSYRRSQEARINVQQLSSSLEDLAVLVAALDKRWLQQAEADDAARERVAVGHTLSPVPEQLDSVTSSAGQVGVLGASGDDRRRAERALEADAELAAIMHYMSLFHAVALGRLRWNEDLTTFSKHQLPPGDPSEEAFAADDRQTARRAAHRLPVLPQRIPGTSVGEPNSPSSWAMLKVAILAHWREYQAHSAHSTAAWVSWMLGTLPALCVFEILTLLDLVPGRSNAFKRELQRMCPLTVLLGASKEEVDDLISAGEGAARTAQVWLQDALMAPSKNEHSLEPSGEEHTRMQALLGNAAAASEQARGVLSDPHVLWTRSSDTLIALLSIAFPLIAASNVSTSAIGAIISFVMVTAFAGINEAARSHDDALGTPNTLPEVAVSQLQHRVNEQLLAVARADCPGHSLYVLDAWSRDLNAEVPSSHTRSSLSAAAGSEAVYCRGRDAAGTGGDSVVLSMDVLPQAMVVPKVATSGANVATSGTGVEVLSRAMQQPSVSQENSQENSQQSTHVNSGQQLAPIVGAASNDSQTSAASASTVRSATEQLSVRIADTPLATDAMALEGHSRAGSYDATLAGLESLPSHFSPDADSEGSSGHTKAALAALLRDNSDDATDPGEMRTSDGSVVYHTPSHSRQSSRTFSGSFSSSRPPTLEDACIGADRGPHTTHTAVNYSANYSVNCDDTDLSHIAAQVFNSGKKDVSSQCWHSVDSQSSKGGAPVAMAVGGDMPSDSLKRSPRRSSEVSTGALPNPNMNPFEAFSAGSSGTMQRPHSCKLFGQAGNSDAWTCISCMHREMMYDSDACGFDMPSGTFSEMHDMHDRARHMRCSSGAGSAVYASSHGSSRSRRPSAKGEVIVDLTGVGFPGPQIEIVDVVGFDTAMTTLQTLSPLQAPLQAENPSRAAASNIASLRTEAPLGEFTTLIRTANSLQACDDSAAAVAAADSTASWPSRCLRIPERAVETECSEPETPKNFANIDALSASSAQFVLPMSVMRRLRPLSLDATHGSGEEFGTPVSGLINPLCSSPRLEAATNPCSHSHTAGSSHQANPPSGATSATCHPAPPFCAPKPRTLPSYSMSSTLENPLATAVRKRQATETMVWTTGNLITPQQRSGHRLGNPSNEVHDAQLPLSSQSSLLYASQSSANSAADAPMHGSPAKSDILPTKQTCDVSNQAEDNYLASESKSLRKQLKRVRSVKASQVCGTGRLDPEDLTPLPRSCSVYSTDPETDLARLLSPSHSDGANSVAMDSLPSSIAPSRNSSPRKSIANETVAPQATSTTPPVKPPPAQLQDRLADYGKTINAVEDMATAAVAPVANVTRTHAVNACEPFTVCSDAHVSVDDDWSKALDIAQVAWGERRLPQCTRACNFDDGILIGYGPVPVPLSRHKTPGADIVALTLASSEDVATGASKDVDCRSESSKHVNVVDAAIVLDSCEEISEDLAESSDSVHHNCGVDVSTAKVSGVLDESTVASSYCDCRRSSGDGGVHGENSRCMFPAGAILQNECESKTVKTGESVEDSRNSKELGYKASAPPPPSCIVSTGCFRYNSEAAQKHNEENMHAFHAHGGAVTKNNSFDSTTKTQALESGGLPTEVHVHEAVAEVASESSLPLTSTTRNPSKVVATGCYSAPCSELFESPSLPSPCPRKSRTDWPDTTKAARNISPAAKRIQAQLDLFTSTQTHSYSSANPDSPYREDNACQQFSRHGGDNESDEIQNFLSCESASQDPCSPTYSLGGGMDDAWVLEDTSSMCW